MSRSDTTTAVPTSSAESGGSHHPQYAASPAHRVSSLWRSALSYAARCHLGQRRESDGAPFVEHLAEVARLLRDAGCGDVVVAAGLLHSVLQDTDVGADELTERFGAGVCALVQVMTDDSVASYPRRKMLFRKRIRETGNDAALLFAAVEIAEVRELAAQIRRERVRGIGASGGGEVPERLVRYRQMCMEHHRASLGMLQDLAPGHRLVRQLAGELDHFPVLLHGARRAGVRR